MNIRFSSISIALLAGALALPAAATSVYTPIGGEGGGRTHAMPSVKTRQQVQQELAAWRANPVSADGWRDVGGEAGAVYVGNSSSGRSRADVISEAQQARRNPVNSDGWLDVGGEAGAVFVGIPTQPPSSVKTARPDGGRCDRVSAGLSGSGHMANNSSRMC